MGGQGDPIESGLGENTHLDSVTDANVQPTNGNDEEGMGKHEDDVQPGEVENNEEQIERTEPVLEIVEDNTEEVAANEEGSGEAIGAEGSSIETIANAAKTGWDVMKDNKPAANVSSDNASATPAGASLIALTGWAPEPRRMKLHYHTGSKLGDDVNATDIYMTCTWYFNGQYQGTGQYINGATVIATGDVAWGNTVNIKVSFDNPINLGTAQKPIAALPVRIALQESNLLQSRLKAWEGMIQGNGGGQLAPV